VTKNSQIERRREFLDAYDALLARWPAGWEAAEITSPYGITRVNISGPPGSPPLILLPGWGATSAVWFAVVGALSRDWRVYAVDLMGDAGRSVPEGRPVRTAADASDWLDAVGSGLGLTSHALCGHSYGAWLALGYALQAPGRVRALALLDPTHCFAGYRPGYLARGLPVLTRPSAARTEAFLRWETGGAPLEAAWLRLAGLAAGVRWSSPVRTRRFRRADLERLAVPALVVLAERSRAHNIRRAAAGAARAGPRGARVKLLPGASHHAIPAGHADALCGLLLGFLADPDRPEPG